MTSKVKITKLPHAHNLSLPQYATEGSAGLDLYAAINDTTILKAGEFIIIPTGISIELSNGFEAQVRARSGLAAKNGLTVLNSPGTIDSDFRGEIKIILVNHSKKDYMVEPGSRIAQLVVCKYEKIEWDEQAELNTTIRGEQGFGSTGV